MELEGQGALLACSEQSVCVDQALSAKYYNARKKPSVATPKRTRVGNGLPGQAGGRLWLWWALVPMCGYMNVSLGTYMALLAILVHKFSSVVFMGRL